MTVSEFDFRKPPSGELEEQAKQWSIVAAQRAIPVWLKLLPFPAEFATESVVTMTAAAALAALPGDAAGFRVTPSTRGQDPDPYELNALIAMPRSVLIALHAGLLGESTTTLPADRDLSSLEISLSGYLLKELFLTPYEKAWPAAEEPIELTPGDGGSPRIAWRMPGENMVVLVRLQLKTPFGEHPGFLVLPRSPRFEKLIRPVPRPAIAPVSNPRQIEALVKEMAVDLSVVLGEAELTMGELARLRSGDLVILRQKVSDPLIAEVCGARKFQCWPGAVGTRAAVKISSTTEE